jgi:hypothetical protein
VSHSERSYSNLHPHPGPAAPSDAANMSPVCPVCGAMVEPMLIGGKQGWTCLAGGYSHYYQAQYGHLKGWFTSGQGNLREPLIDAMDCAA